MRALVGYVLSRGINTNEEKDEKHRIIATIPHVREDVASNCHHSLALGPSSSSSPSTAGFTLDRDVAHRGQQGMRGGFRVQGGGFGVRWEASFTNDWEQQVQISEEASS